MSENGAAFSSCDRFVLGAVKFPTWISTWFWYCTSWLRSDWQMVGARAGLPNNWSSMPNLKCDTFTYETTVRYWSITFLRFIYICGLVHSAIAMVGPWHPLTAPLFCFDVASTGSHFIAVGILPPQRVAPFPVPITRAHKRIRLCDLRNLRASTPSSTLQVVFTPGKSTNTHHHASCYWENDSQCQSLWRHSSWCARKCHDKWFQ